MRPLMRRLDANGPLARFSSRLEYSGLQGRPATQPMPAPERASPIRPRAGCLKGKPRSRCCAAAHCWKPPAKRPPASPAWRAIATDSNSPRVDRESKDAPPFLPHQVPANGVRARPCVWAASRIRDGRLAKRLAEQLTRRVTGNVASEVMARVPCKN